MNKAEGKHCKFLLLGSLPLLRTFHSSVEHSHLLTPAVTFGKVMSEFKTWIFLVTPKCSLEAPASLLARREVESVYTAGRRPPRGTFSCITQSGRSSGSLPPALTPSDTCALPSAPHCLRGGLNLSCLPSATRTMHQGLPLESTGNAEKIRSTADSASFKTCRRDSRHACLTTHSRKHLKTPCWGLPSLTDAACICWQVSPWVTALVLCACSFCPSVFLPGCLCSAFRVWPCWLNGAETGFRKVPDCFPSHATSVKTRSTVSQQSFSFPEQSSSQEGLPGVPLGASELTSAKSSVNICWSSVDLSVLSLLGDQPRCNQISSKLWIVSDWV